MDKIETFLWSLHMKILILSYKDSGGGAPNVAYRLAEALNNFSQEIQATLGVVEASTSSDFVKILPKCKITRFRKIILKIKKIAKKFLNMLFPKIFDFLKYKTSNGMGISTNLKSTIDVNWINDSDFDLVNFHWPYFDMISIKDISKINKPIVWTMHDSWICCGVELHPNILEHDTRYTEKFTKKNRPTYQAGIDIDKKVWRLKEKYLSQKNIIFHAPSNWESSILETSFLFRGRKCNVIPNIVNHADFHPLDKIIAKSVLQIPLNKKILGFGAIGGINNPKSLKGPMHLIKALDALENKEDYFLIIYGYANIEFTQYLHIPFFCSGLVENTKIMSLLYNACDVVINPSLIENLPTVCVEAISCGVPVVAFDAGGTRDVIEHKVNGYLAKCYDINDLARGIEYCYEHRETLGKAGYEKSITAYDTDKLIKQYIELYKGTIESWNMNK